MCFERWRVCECVLGVGELVVEECLVLVGGYEYCCDGGADDSYDSRVGACFVEPLQERHRMREREVMSLEREERHVELGRCLNKALCHAPPAAAAAAPAKCGVHGQPKRLIVIANWRTGSVLLSKILHSHPDINLGPTPFAGELFRQQEREFKDLDWPSYIRATWDRHFSAPDEYLEAAFAIRRQARPDAAVLAHKF